MFKYFKRFGKFLWSIRRFFVTVIGSVTIVILLYFAWVNRDTIWSMFIIGTYIVFTTLAPAVLWIIDKLKRRRKD